MNSESADERDDDSIESGSSDIDGDSSSDEFEEDQLVQPADPDIENKITTKEKVEAAMHREKKEIEQALEYLSKAEDDISALTSEIDELRNSFFYISPYQDVTPLFIAGSAFLLDASSLCICAVRESNYNSSHGGQSLHFIYICEKIIQLLSRKGGQCHVIFFKEKSKVWYDAPNLSMAENILRHHLKNNTEIPTKELDSICDQEFERYIKEVQPNFIVLSFTLLDCLKNEFESQEMLHLYESVFSIYSLLSLSLGLYCTDINSLQLGSNDALMMYGRNSISSIVSYREILQKYCAAVLSKFPNTAKETNTSPTDIEKLQTIDVRRFIMIRVAESIINDDQFSYREELAKAVLVYAAVIEVFPMEARCFTHSIEPTDFSKKLVHKVVQSIDIELRINRFEGFDHSSVADIWHGNLFIEILSSIVTMQECNSLGCAIDVVYEEYISEFNNITSMKLQTFPISFSHITEDVNFEKNIKIIDQSSSFSRESCNLPVVNNEIFKSFCKDVCSENEASSDKDDENNQHGTVSTNLKWQNTVKLTSFIDRITNYYEETESIVVSRYKKVSNPKRKKWLIKRAMTRLKGLFAYYSDMYAINLEGKIVERKAILVSKSPVKKSESSKKSQKKDKLSKGAAKLIEENNLKKEKKVLEEENTTYVNFKKQYKTNTNSGKSYQVNLTLVNHVLTNVKTDLYYCKVMLYKVEILFYLWEEECKKCKLREERDPSYVKELFLAIREVVSCAQKDSSLLGEREQAKIGKKLCQLGFKGLAQECALPVTEDDRLQSNMHVSVNQSCARFQMQHLGHDLLKNAELAKDPRAVDYIPDQWQRDMFDVIDKRHSAFVVAPNSSGKTRATYYCMERVLRESNNSKVVYVAPTAAHMLEVAATADYRFKGKAGIVQGILTKQYQLYVSECQILATVPECLEALFTLPEFHTWTKQLRYAIFDDIDSMTNCENGVSWERCLTMIPCPFIALSATIQNPESMHTWMQNIERFKQELDPSIGSRVVLIAHSERHTDLVKHIYDPVKGLQQIHPVSCLTKQMMDAHQGIPKQSRLAPNETIQLYDMMLGVAGKDDPDLIDLEPEKFFASGFISMDDAKKYEFKIRQAFGNWSTNKRQLADETAMRFRAQITANGGNQTMAQVMAVIKGFVELLRNKGMLPAIVLAHRNVKCLRLSRFIADVYREEEENNAPKPKKNPISAVDSHNDFGDRNEKKPPVKKNPNHPNTRRLGGSIPLNPLGLTECSAQYSVRGVVSQSLKDFLFIEESLWEAGFKKGNTVIEIMRRGIGVLHTFGMSTYNRSVKWLFRKKYLNIVFANGTVDCDVRMPCRTVVVLGDGPLLNTVTFHQICARAGRRTLDQTGNVVFFGLDANKVLSLQTAKLPKMHGNYPLTVTAVLQFLQLYSSTRAAKEKDKEKEKRLVLNRILTVLNGSLLYEAYPDLKVQMKYYFGFCCHFLINLRLLNAESGEFHRLTSLVSILHKYERGVLAFVYLLETGFFNELCLQDDKQSVSETSCDTAVLILCHLFTCISFPSHVTATYENEKEVDFKLPRLPDNALKALQSYNSIVKKSFMDYYKNVAKFNAEKFGKDEKLPISRKTFKGRSSVDDLKKDGASLESMLAKNSASNSACSVYAGLSGQTDNELIVDNAIIGNVRDEIFPNSKCVPLVELDAPLDAFAYNVYKYGVVRPTMLKDHLKPGSDYKCLTEFRSVLDNVKQSLEELQLVNEEGVDMLVGVRKTFAQVTDTYHNALKRIYFERKL